MKCRSESKNWLTKLKEYFWSIECEGKSSVLIDVDDLLPLIKDIDKGNYSRNRKCILSDFPKTYFNQHEKFLEIFQKINDLSS